jgi:hypothetical protein
MGSRVSLYVRASESAKIKASVFVKGLEATEGEHPVHMADSDQRAEGPQGQDAAEATHDRARHWTAFYQELIGYEERILESMRELSAGMSAGEKEAVRKTNLEPLEELIDDFRRRLELWRRRMEAEEADPKDAPEK